MLRRPLEYGYMTGVGTSVITCWPVPTGSEGCSTPAPFVRSDGTPYLEPHHLRRLSDGGPDHPAHVIALCPTCHRRVHAGADGDTYNAKLDAAMPTIEVLAQRREAAGRSP